MICTTEKCCKENWSSKITFHNTINIWEHYVKLTIWQSSETKYQKYRVYRENIVKTVKNAFIISGYGFCPFQIIYIHIHFKMCEKLHSTLMSPLPSLFLPMLTLPQGGYLVIIYHFI